MKKKKQVEIEGGYGVGDVEEPHGTYPTLNESRYGRCGHEGTVHHEG